MIYGPKTAKRILDGKAKFDLDVEEIENTLRVFRMNVEKMQRETAEREAKRAQRSTRERNVWKTSGWQERREKDLKRGRERERERLERERIEREAREKEDAKRKQRKERARKRRALEHSKTPSEALSMLREDVDSNVEVSVRKSLLYILNGILDHPEETSWRRLRKSNEKLNRDILQHRGGRIFLLSCGFRERILHLNFREILVREIRAYYEATAPQELRERGGRVDVEKLATHYERNPSELWRRLSKKYGHGRPLNDGQEILDVTSRTKSYLGGTGCGDGDR